MKRIDRLWGHIILLCTASGFLGVLIGLVVGSPTDGNWLYEWQTLIAGCLAVGAAFFTIREARRQYMFSRWTEHVKQAEDYKIMQGLALKMDGMLERAEPCLTQLLTSYAKKQISASSVERLDLEPESNIRQAFNPFFFDAYASLSKKMSELNQVVYSRGAKNMLLVQNVSAQYQDIVQELQALNRTAIASEKEGQAFIRQVNKTYPRDLRLHLGLKVTD